MLNYGGQRPTWLDSSSCAPHHIVSEGRLQLGINANILFSVYLFISYQLIWLWISCPRKIISRTERIALLPSPRRIWKSARTWFRTFWPRRGCHRCRPCRTTRSAFRHSTPWRMDQSFGKAGTTWRWSTKHSCLFAPPQPRKKWWRWRMACGM